MKYTADLQKLKEQTLTLRGVDNTSINGIKTFEMQNEFIEFLYYENLKLVKRVDELETRLRGYQNPLDGSKNML